MGFVPVKNPDSASDSSVSSNPSRFSGTVRIRYSGDPNTPSYQRLLNFLVYFHGSTPVQIEFNDGSIAPLDPVCSIDVSEDVIVKLQEFCGEGNVSFV